MTNEIPLMILASVALLACGNAGLLDGLPNSVTRVDGIMLLLFFCIFMRYTFAQAKALPEGETAAGEGGAPMRPMPAWKACLMIVVGLVGLVWGGDIFVDSASSLARRCGMSQAVIGLTIVALGTSLPELATSVVAAVKGHPGLAVGNVIGSNLFNILLCWGLHQ